MPRLQPALGVFGLAAIAAIVIVIVAGAGPDQRMMYHSQSGDYVIPRVRIIAFDESVALFDTRDGALYRFHGDLRNPAVRSVWVKHVPGLPQPTSGVMEIQKAEGVNPHQDATFLVDVFTGETWILRRRGANAAWDPVKIFE